VLLYVVSNYTRSERTYFVSTFRKYCPFSETNQTILYCSEIYCPADEHTGHALLQALLFRCDQWKPALHRACTGAACMQIQSAATDVTYTTPTTTNRLDMMNGQTEIDQLKWTALIPGRSAISAPKLCVLAPQSSPARDHACMHVRSSCV